MRNIYLYKEKKVPEIKTCKYTNNETEIEAQEHIAETKRKIDRKTYREVQVRTERKIERETHGQTDRRSGR